MNMVEQERFKESPLGILVTVDGLNILRLYAVNHESTEMVASQKLSVDDEDKVNSVHFFVKAKSFIITTEKGQCFIVTCEKDLADQTNIMSYFKDH